VPAFILPSQTALGSLCIPLRALAQVSSLMAPFKKSWRKRHRCRRVRNADDGTFRNQVGECPVCLPADAEDGLVGRCEFKLAAEEALCAMAKSMRQRIAQVVGCQRGKSRHSFSRIQNLGCLENTF
jgi:hypothetical protein